MARKKTWREKLVDSKDLPKVVALDASARRRWKGETMAIPAPMEVNDIMNSVPKGKLITINEIRKIVARTHKADIGCPLTCGIFSWIAAHAAAEAAGAGQKKVTPYWRTLKSGGVLNPKYPGGIEQQQRLLESEGHKVSRSGKTTRVEGFETKLVRA
jgi:alkylated DNA nucleotide flippase Atl1